MLRRFFLAAVAGIAFVSACGDSTGPDANITGTYSLMTVDGNNLPWRFLVIGNDWIEITSGTGNINADGTFSMTFNYRESSSGQVSTFSESGSGTYTRNGNAISFSFTLGGSANGTINGNQISVTDEDGVVYVFRRN